VVGASGFIGQILWRALPAGRRAGTYCASAVAGLEHLDLRDASQTLAFVGRVAPSVIFQTAALPNVDWCEDHRRECWAMNVEGTANLARAAREVGAKLVYFSTDYVFDGRDGPYAEDDTPNPISVYGEAKLAAERFIQEHLPDHLIVRVTVVYGWERRGKNFVMGLIRRLGHGETIPVPGDQIGSPTYADNLVDVVLDLVSADRRGIYHVAGSEVMDRYTFACLAADTFGLDKAGLLRVTTAELGQRAARPLRAGMRVDKVRSVVTTPLLAPAEGLRRMRDQGNPFARS
jgi:dTDP-4-dehydrorhamnose reductase